MNSKQERVIIFGGGGFVGEQFIKSCSKLLEIISPSSKKLNILNKTALKTFFKQQKGIKAVINFAAYTDISSAEKERANKKGPCFRVNAEGACNLASQTHDLGIFFIQISTDSIFPGTDNFPGPYLEKSKPKTSLNNLSWYGYTKLVAEQKIKKSNSKSAIVRISFPFGNPNSKKDYCLKVLTRIIQNKPLFSDQVLSPTYLNNLSLVLRKLIYLQQPGIYHVATTDLVTPYNFGKYLETKLGLNIKINRSTIAKITSNQYLKKGGLASKDTQYKLGLSFHSVKEAIDEFADILKPAFLNK
ncbi:sugar nucleotide-binding protein [Candidatus Daviesbacteria bacterium]|nr:sugar nucleotide-binding protein [Candidatus Daviesbacteria bacterium]